MRGKWPKNIRRDKSTEHDQGILTGLVQGRLDVVDGELPLSEEGEVSLEHQDELLAVPVLQDKHQALQIWDVWERM